MFSMMDDAVKVEKTSNPGKLAVKKIEFHFSNGYCASFLEDHETCEVAVMHGNKIVTGSYFPVKPLECAVRVAGTDELLLMLLEVASLPKVSQGE